jgi:Tfp pilus assembly protein PilF
LQTAARLDTSYAEPHVALARIYHKLGQEATAREEEQAYLHLRAHESPE